MTAVLGAYLALSELPHILLAALLLWAASRVIRHHTHRRPPQV